MTRFFPLAGLVGALLGGPALGQSPPPQAAASSALPGYRPFTDEPVASWRAVNDLVGRLGGWRAYAHEAAAPASAPAPAASPAPAPVPATDPHAGHHGGHP